MAVRKALIALKDLPEKMYRRHVAIDEIKKLSNKQIYIWTA